MVVEIVIVFKGEMGFSTQCSGKKKGLRQGFVSRNRSY